VLREERDILKRATAFFARETGERLSVHRAEKQGRGASVGRASCSASPAPAYYAWSAADPEKRRRADDELLQAISDAHQASRGTYGAPRITKALRKQGRHVARKRVARLMRQRGIWTCSPPPQAHHYRRSRRAKAADLLQRNFTPAAHAIDTAWCSDISYVRTWRAGPTGHRDRPFQPARRRAGHGRSPQDLARE